MKSITKEWYEAIQVKGYGCKLATTFETYDEAKEGIEEANARAVSLGYKAEEFYIVKYRMTRTIDDNGDVVSEICGYYKVD